MSRILEATCSAAGIVTADGVPVSDVELLGEGRQTSEGILILDKDVKKYLPAKSSTDLKNTLLKLSSSVDDIAAALTEIASTLTAIGGGMTGSTTAPPPTLATSVATINSKVTELNATKAEIDQLKEALK